MDFGWVESIRSNRVYVYPYGWNDIETAQQPKFLCVDCSL